jgi:hypothetical protein
VATTRKPAGKRTVPDLQPHPTDLATIAGINREAAEAAVRSSPPSEELPDAKLMSRLAAVKVQELTGAWTTIGATWEANPAALVFLRHYG